MIKLFTQNHNIFSWRVKVYFMNNAKYARAKMTNVHFEKVHTFTNYDLRRRPTAVRAAGRVAKARRPEGVRSREAAPNQLRFTI